MAARPRRRPARGGGRRKVVRGPRSGQRIPLEDAPLCVLPVPDHARVVAVTPYEAAVVLPADGKVERALAVDAPRPSVACAADGTVWLGGRHLHRGSLFSDRLTKVGTGMRGFADAVVLVRPSTLVGVGGAGEVIVDVVQGRETFRRKAGGGRTVHTAVPAADGRCVYVTGEPFAWILDPDRPEGHTRFSPRAAGSGPWSYPVTTAGVTADGSVVLAAEDGTVAWTNRALRIAGQATPADTPAPAPLCAFGDADFVYVLRAGGVLDRFRRVAPEEEDAPPAERAAVETEARCACLLPGDQLCLGVAEAGGDLGALKVRPLADLVFAPLALGPSPPSAAERGQPSPDSPPAEPPPVRALQGEGVRPLCELSVDEVLRGGSGLFLAVPRRDLGAWQVQPAGDGPPPPEAPLLAAAMVRFAEGTARPALRVLPGTFHGPELPDWIVWGDAPRGWIALRTPEIRRQGWSRRDVFPLEAALRPSGATLGGRAAALPPNLAGPDRFDALARECRRALAVVW